ALVDLLQRRRLRRRGRKQPDRGEREHENTSCKEHQKELSELVRFWTDFLTRSGPSRQFRGSTHEMLPSRRLANRNRHFVRAGAERLWILGQQRRKWRLIQRWPRRRSLRRERVGGNERGRRDDRGGGRGWRGGRRWIWWNGGFSHGCGRHGRRRRLRASRSEERRV